MWSLFDLFLEEEFLMTILDVGAAMLAKPAYQTLIDRKRARLIGFEPDEEACRELRKAYEEPHQILPYFISSGEERIFYETNWGPTGSLFEPNTELLEKFQNLAELVTTVATHSVKTTALDSLEEIGEVDFFKIDVQGSELDIFENATNILKNTLVIQTEVEFVKLYQHQPLFADIDVFLREQGFQFLRFTGFGTRPFKPLIFNNNPNIGNQYLWADAIYVRDWLHLDELSELQLKKYAILMHDLFGIYDLAHFVLAALDRKTAGTLAETYREKLLAQPVQ